MNKIYFDNSATTKQDPRVTEVMDKTYLNCYGNPSSIHSFGQLSRTIIDEARDTISTYLNCLPQEIIFTSGGSEGDNLAIKGVVEAGQLKRRRSEKNVLPHIITSQIEHPAVLKTVKMLEKEGKIEATYIKPKSNGVVRVDEIKDAIRENTVLVSIIYVNNEIGTVEPIREIGKMIESVNKERAKDANRGDEYKHSFSRGVGEKNQKRDREVGNKVYFHTDAVQAVEYFPLDTKYLHVDLMTLSGHKFYGPKGVGVLYIKKETEIRSQIIGGEQEYKKRAGTENVAAIAGIAEAIRQVQKDQDKEARRVKQLRNKLIAGLLRIPDSRINGCKVKRSPNNINVSFKGAEGESILMMLDQQGIAASSGSACTSGSLEPSHVLTAIGVKPEWSHGSVRFSLGKNNTVKEVERVIEIMPVIIKRLREMSPIK